MNGMGLASKVFDGMILLTTAALAAFGVLVAALEAPVVGSSVALTMLGLGVFYLDDRLEERDLFPGAHLVGAVLAAIGTTLPPVALIFGVQPV